MPEFILDTAGKVPMAPLVEFDFKSLDAFTQGYIEALFFTSNSPGVSTEEFRAADHQSDMEAGRADGVLPCDVGFGDLAPDALASILADCQAFQAANAALLAEAYARDYEPEQAGRDYWFTRNGHGVGFWSRARLEPSTAEYERLTAVMVANRDNPKAWGEALRQRDALAAESIGERLSTAAGSREIDVYFGDDGKVHLS